MRLIRSSGRRTRYANYKASLGGIQRLMLPIRLDVKKIVSRRKETSLCQLVAYCYFWQYRILRAIDVKQRILNATNV